MHDTVGVDGGPVLRTALAVQLDRLDDDARRHVADDSRHAGVDAIVVVGVGGVDSDDLAGVVVDLERHAVAVERPGAVALRRVGDRNDRHDVRRQPDLDDLVRITLAARGSTDVAHVTHGAVGHDRREPVVVLGAELRCHLDGSVSLEHERVHVVVGAGVPADSRRDEIGLLDTQAAALGDRDLLGAQPSGRSRLRCGDNTAVLVSRELVQDTHDIHFPSVSPARMSG